MSVLICDSNGELWHTRAKELGLDYISMPYYVGGKEYFYDLGEKTDFRAFYDAVRGGEIPKTQALNPEDYKRILMPYFERGEDILYVSFSHKLSGTFTSLGVALAALKEQFPDRKCTVFDTENICLGTGIQAEEAALLKQKGASDEEILAFLEDLRGRVRTYFIVDDLMHLKRGGRCSGLAAVAGTILGLKPMILVQDGELKVVGKVSGKKRVLATLADKVITELGDESKRVYVVDADCPEEGDRLRDLILEKRPNAKTVRQTIGPVIGSHCGPGTLGVIFVA